MTTYIWVALRIVAGTEERFASWDEDEVRSWAEESFTHHVDSFPMSGKLRVA